MIPPDRFGNAAGEITQGAFHYLIHLLFVFKFSKEEALFLCLTQDFASFLLVDTFEFKMFAQSRNRTRATRSKADNSTTQPRRQLHSSEVIMLYKVQA